jgi:Zn-finger nucleic acid-binding protein
MEAVDGGAAISCPNCRLPMQTQTFERHEQGSVCVDLCFGCAGIWFDRLESVQLAPSSVLQLFRELYAHRDDPRRSLAAELQCPRCSNLLALSHDLGKTGPFSYYRCHQGDGRFTPFFQFLREKQFVRTLTAAEISRVRSLVRQIKCSQCGAPIDLEHDTRCSYCRAPISFLDTDAIEKALRVWSDSPSHGPQQTAVGVTPDALRHLLGDRIALTGMNAGIGATGWGPDLVARGIRALGSLFER